MSRALPLTLAASLALALAAGGVADDFVRVRPGPGMDLEARPRRGQREVLHRPGVFVDMVATPAMRRDLETRGFQLELLQEGIDRSLAELRRPGAGGYHRYWDVLAKVEGWRRQRPDLVQVLDIGSGGEVLAQGGRRRVMAARFALGEGPRPRLLLFGGIHARELATTEVPLLLGDRLVREAGTDPALTRLLETREIWLVPLLNPDGREYCFSHDPWWRKNRNLQPSGHMGVDLNRNFGYRWGPNPPLGGSSGNPTSGIYRGPRPFSEPETRALRDLVTTTDFSISLSLHSYGEMVLLPFGFGQEATEHQPLYDQLARVLREATGYQVGPVPDVLGYYSNGRHDDWLYAAREQGKGMTAAVELEIGRSFFPTYPEVERLAGELGEAVLAVAGMAGASLAMEVEVHTLAADHHEVVVTVRNLGVRDASGVQLRLDRAAPGRRGLGRRSVGVLPGLGTQGMAAPAAVVVTVPVRGPLKTLRVTATATGELPVQVEQTVPIFAD